MGKSFIALIGILLFFGSIFLAYNLLQGQKLAASLDDEKKAFAMVGEDAPPSCNWKVKEPERVMGEDKSQAVVIETENAAKKACQTYLTLRAPGFSINPQTEGQEIKLPPKAKGSISWIIIPHKTGTFDITVSDIINTKIYGITVTNVFGLTAVQAQLFSIAGTLFGPMFTIPWWWDRLRQRKRKEEPPKEN